MHDFVCLKMKFHIQMHVCIFQLTQEGFSIALQVHVDVHVWNLNLSIVIKNKTMNSNNKTPLKKSKIIIKIQ